MTGPAPLRTSHWLAFLAIQLVLAGLAAQLYASLTNTLARNGNWASTKTSLAKRVMGARTFMTTSQTLAGQRLDLGRWHGFQEILYDKPLLPREVSFDCRLVEGAYLIFVFDKTEAGFSGLRLSRSELYDSIYFSARDDGEFTVKEPLADVEPGDGWMRVRVSFEEARVSAWLDGRPLGSFAAPQAGRSRVGFRNGLHSALIDDVEIWHADATRPVRESFANGRGFRRALALSAAILVVLNALMAGTIRRKGLEASRLIFAGITVVLTASLCLLICSVAYHAFFSEYYAAVAHQREIDFKESEVRTIRDQLRARYPEPPDDTTIRVLVVGTSQTWGAGAAREDEAFPAVLEKLLNAAAPNGLRFECVNAGISAIESSRLLEIYAEDWVHYSPDLVVINLSSNDGTAKVFQESLESFARIDEEHGVKTLFALEPNSPEHRPRSLSMHTMMRLVASRRGVPVVDLHDYMKRQSGRGLIWWDFVHPTSFGHRLIAEALQPVVLGLATELAKVRAVRDDGPVLHSPHDSTKGNE